MIFLHPLCVLRPRITNEERKERLAEQARTNEFHRFTEGHLILKQGLIDKRKVRYTSVLLGLANCNLYLL